MISSAARSSTAADGEPAGPGSAVATALPNVVEFGEFRIEIEERRVLCNGVPMPLQPRAFDLLLAFLRYPGRLLTRRWLMDHVWGDAHVEDANLTQNVSLLRRALQEPPGRARYLVTVPGEGYRFEAPLRASMSGARGSAQGVADGLGDRRRTGWRGWKTREILLGSLVVICLIGGLWALARTESAAGPEIRSVAVLPFSALNRGEEAQLLGLSLADGLAFELSRRDDLRVVSTRAVLPYVDTPADALTAGQRLGVDAVVEGTVQHSQGRVRLNARLVQVRGGGTLWSQTLEDAAGSPFDLEDAFVRSLSASFPGAASSVVPASPRRDDKLKQGAHIASLKGQLHLRRRSTPHFARAVASFEEALELDPSSASPRAGLAQVFLLKAFYETEREPPGDNVELARGWAEEALARDPNQAQALAVQASIHADYDFDWRRAEHGFRRAIELDPYDSTARYWYSLVLLTLGRAGDARTELLRAIELDPGSVVYYHGLGDHYYFCRQMESARNHYAGLAQLGVASTLVDFLLAKVSMQQGKTEEALPAYRRIAAPGLLAYALGRAGRAEEAKQVLRQVGSPAELTAQHRALALVGTGEPHRALDQLEDDLAERALWPLWLRADPALDPLRDQPRFHALLRAMGLPIAPISCPAEAASASPDA